jgi:hypothetical protein
MTPPISEELLDRYLAGLCTPEEVADVERMLGAHPEIQGALDHLLAAASAAPANSPRTQDAWARFEQRLADADNNDADSRVAPTGVHSPDTAAVRSPDTDLQDAPLPWWGLTAQWAHSIMLLGLAFGIVAIATIGFASVITQSAPPQAVPGLSNVSLMSAVTNDVAEQPLVEMTLHPSDDDWLAASVR